VGSSCSGGTLFPFKKAASASRQPDEGRRIWCVDGAKRAIITQCLLDQFLIAQGAVTNKDGGATEHLLKNLQGV
jgi:hypothetical protein